MKRAILLGGLFLVSVSFGAETKIYHDGWNDLNKNGKKDVYEDPGKPIEKRVADLLHRMTLDEKIGQLVQVDMPSNSATLYGTRLTDGGIGAFLEYSVDIENPGLRNRIQRILVEQSRLGIPLILGHDAIHGFRTIFPIPLAQSCAWDAELFERTQSISARESDAAGVDWAFAPMVDLARDPRWGRIAEGFGEDPNLGELDAAASVRGFQGTNVAAPGRIVACLKHYVGYGAAEGGRDYNTTEIPDYTLRNFYLPQFKAGLDAGAWTVMSAFNALNGVSASGNYHTLTGILRNEWKFRGFVVSDWKAVDQLIEHGMAADSASAARLALTSGVDMEMVSSDFSTLKRQVLEGSLPEKAIDEAVRRVLTVKFVRGLFEHPYKDESLWKDAYLRPDAIALAREAAAMSCVLLKNDKEVLPLSSQITNIALIGPLAEDENELFGCWASRGHASDLVSLASGIRGNLPTNVELTVVHGCALTEGGKPRLRVGDYSELKDEVFRGNEEIDRAVAAAKAADVVILALGERRDWSGEDAARSTLDLPGRQTELFQAVAATGKPVVVVLFNGRPLALPEFEEKAAAILEAWQPGVQAGNGVADVLFGKVSPTGRLTTSFPRNVGQLPVYYNHYNTGRPKEGRYVDGSREPLYPFGYGLSYTKFEYGPARTSSSSFGKGQTLAATVSVRNVGKMEGTETVQLYLRGLSFSAGSRPVRQLKGFQHVRLGPGESREVSFQLTDRDLGYFDAKGHWLVEAGKYQLWLARNSAEGAPVSFELR
jgi:beta-glucosidase